MKYIIRFTPAARSQLRAIDRPTAMRIFAALTPLGEDPYRDDVDVKKLKGTGDHYRMRVGDYRVAYRIEDHELVIEIVRVGHRRDVYRSL